MKRFITLFFISCAFAGGAQKTLEPYIKDKSNKKENFDVVKARMFGGYKGKNEGGKYVKYARKNISSVLSGKKTEFNHNHSQIIFCKIKATGLMKGRIEEGKKPYEILIKNGTNMLISEFVKTTGPSMTPSLSGNSYGTTTSAGRVFYLVKNNETTTLSGFEWITNDFIDKLIGLFDNCPSLAEELQSYRDKKAKILHVIPFVQRIKTCYYTTCYSE